MHGTSLAQGRCGRCCGNGLAVQPPRHHALAAPAVSSNAVKNRLNAPIIAQRRRPAASCRVAEGEAPSEAAGATPPPPKASRKKKAAVTSDALSDSGEALSPKRRGRPKKDAAAAAAGLAGPSTPKVPTEGAAAGPTTTGNGADNANDDDWATGKSSSSSGASSGASRGGDRGRPEEVLDLGAKVPAGPEWQAKRRWVVFTDLHVKDSTLDTCVEVLHRVEAEAARRDAGVLFLGRWRVRGAAAGWDGEGRGGADAPGCAYIQYVEKERGGEGQT